MTSREKQDLHLIKAEDFKYLINGNCLTCKGIDDEKQFSPMRDAMKVLFGLDKSERVRIDGWSFLSVLIEII